MVVTMSEGEWETDRKIALQRQVTQVALESADGFALAGSGAIREHGLIGRPTEDIDLFTNTRDATWFDLAVSQVSDRLTASGFSIDQTRRDPEYARIHLTSQDGRDSVEIEMGVDWRRDEPVQFEVGPVLSLNDAVASKVGALYSRGEARDYLDVDAIRGSGRFTDEQLVSALADRDPGFEIRIFADQLATAADRVQPAQVAQYGVSTQQLKDVTTRCEQWATDLYDEIGNKPNSTESVMSAQMEGLIARQRAGFPTPATQATRRQAGPAAGRPAQRGPEPDRGNER